MPNKAKATRWILIKRAGALLRTSVLITAWLHCSDAGNDDTALIKLITSFEVTPPQSKNDETSGS